VLPDHPLISYLDGREVAYSVVGSGPPLVMCGWWAHNLALDWQDQLFRSFVAPFAESHAGCVTTAQAPFARSWGMKQP